MKPDQLVSDFLADRQAEVARGDLSPKTVREYRQPLQQVLLPFCRREGIADATELDETALDRLKDHLLANGASSGKTLSRATVNSYLRAVNVFLNWARKRDSGVEGSVKLLRMKRPTFAVLSRDEINRMENAAERERDKLIVRILADTGIRVGELIGLRVTDILSRERKAFIHVRGKTDSRDVPLMPELHQRVRRYIAETRPKRAQSDRVFLGLRRRPGGDIEPLTESGVQQIVRELAGPDKADIGRRVYCHLFRHSFITDRLNRHMSPLHLKEMVGHKSMTMIDRVYSHITPVDTYEALERSMQGMAN
jgi:integrase